MSRYHDIGEARQIFNFREHEENINLSTKPINDFLNFPNYPILPNITQSYPFILLIFALIFLVVDYFSPSKSMFKFFQTDNQ